VFTVLLDKHAAIWKRLLEFFLPYDGVNRPRIIDFTAGTKATWWDVLEQKCPCCKHIHYDITWCDRDPVWLHEAELRDLYFNEEYVKLRKAKKWKLSGEEALNIEAKRRVEARVSKSIDPLRDIIQRDIEKDSYLDLGIHQAGFIDPPYLIGRNNAFDYHPKERLNRVTMSHSQGMYGPRSWGSSQLGTYVANPTVESFNERIRQLNVKAAEVIEPNGFLFVKVMNVRYDGELINHDVTMIHELTNFKNQERAIYIRQGVTTWIIPGHLQILNVFWMVFRRR
jgi:hypothetical protein